MIISSDFLRPGSSEVDWCEGNYLIVSFIAEFFNTISNAPFFIVPPIMIYLFRSYSSNVTKGIDLIWVFLIIVGLGSVYFHSTLTLAGQLMDELSILWILALSYVVLFPEKYMPSYFVQNRSHMKLICLIVTLVITAGCFVEPKLNAYFLMLFVIPTLVTTVVQIRNCNNAQIKALGKRAIITAGLAVTLWILDRMACDVWTRLRVPVLHSIFHVLILFASNCCIVIFAYFKAAEKASHLAPNLAYWPASSTVNESFRLPFVYFSRLEDPRGGGSGAYEPMTGRGHGSRYTAAGGVTSRNGSRSGSLYKENI